jgi:hypothetical protein
MFGGGFGANAGAVVSSTADHVTAVPAASVVEAVMGDGTLTAGGVVSWTVTVIEAETGSPFSSVAVHVTGVDPTGYWADTLKSPEPLPPGSQDAPIGLPETGSNAFTLYVTIAPDALVASTGDGSSTRSGGGSAKLVEVGTAIKTLPSAAASR